MVITNRIKINRKKFYNSFNAVFFILLIVKCFETFDFFYSNCCTFVALINTNLFPDCAKLIGCFPSAANVVSSNSCVGPSPRIKISFLLLSTCTDELIPAPKTMAFLP